MRKFFTRILLVVVLSVVGVSNGWAQVCKNSTTSVEYNTIQAAIDALDVDGQIIQMIANTSEDGISVSEKNFTLDLNGHVLEGTGTSCVVTVNDNASLTLIDSNSEATYYYEVGDTGLWTWIESPTAEQTSGATAYESLITRPTSGTIISVKGGAITGGIGADLGTGFTGIIGGAITSCGHVTINGGNIIGNQLSRNCGTWGFDGSSEFIVNGGRFIGNVGQYTSNNTNQCFLKLDYCKMNDGEVAFNKMNCIGSAFGLKGTFKINGGKIHNNVVGSEGQLLLSIVTGAQFTMLGGEITGNKFDYGTVKGHAAVTDSGHFIVGGTAKIHGNMMGNYPCNVCMLDGNRINVSTETPLTGDAEIYITTQTSPTAGNPITITGNNSADYSAYFKSDNPTYIISNRGTGNEQVVKLFCVETLPETLENKTYDGEYTIGNDGVNIPEGVTATFTGYVTNSTAANFTIKDGGQLVTTQAVLNATVEKNITAAPNWMLNNPEDWYIISSPVRDITTADVDNMITDGEGEDYDLYRYDEPSYSWINSKHETHGWSDIQTGRGYLYAAETTRTLGFAGELNSGSPQYSLTCNGENLTGFNLLGNPYAQNITLSNISLSAGSFAGGGYYIHTNSGSWIAKTSEDEIAPCTGFLVQVNEAATATFSKTDSPSKDRANHDNIAICVSNNKYEDMAYAMFDEGDGLEKISHRNADAPMLYITQDFENYAIAMMSDDTESFPLSFKANTTGSYTIIMTVSASATHRFSNVRLIDKLTGTDTDMLSGSYTFIGSPADNADRFTVSLSYGENENFVYQNGSDLIVTGDGTVYIIDVLGRTHIIEKVNGAARISTSGLTNGAYIVKVIGNDTKTQKIIVR